MHKKTSTRGRRAGQLGKAHDGVAHIWQHFALASDGNFPPEVCAVAYQLGKLAEEYQRVIVEKQWNLEANRRGITIPLPMLPKGGQFTKDELALLRASGQDVIWVLQHMGYLPAFRALAPIIEAAGKGDVKFFKELARRVGSGIPLDWPAEPVYSALAGLKELYETAQASWEAIDPANRLPSLASVFKRPPGQRPPLTLAQIGDYVGVFANARPSDRTLSVAARKIGLPIAPRGRPKTGT